MREAGAILVGGHSLKDKEPKYGLAVLGVVHPERIIRNHTPLEGDVLILTKPLGTGIISTALKADIITAREVEKAIESMMQLNCIPASIPKNSLHSLTDITGFGFLGHLHEMLVGGDMVADILLEQVPILDRAYLLSQRGIIPGGSIANQKTFSCNVGKLKKIEAAKEILLYDAQTSGGLLISMDPKDAELALTSLVKQGFNASRIVGKIRKKSTNEKKICLT